MRQNDAVRITFGWSDAGYLKFTWDLFGTFLIFSSHVTFVIVANSVMHKDAARNKNIGICLIMDVDDENSSTKRGIDDGKCGLEQN